MTDDQASRKRHMNASACDHQKINIYSGTLMARTPLEP